MSASHGPKGPQPVALPGVGPGSRDPITAIDAMLDRQLHRIEDAKRDLTSARLALRSVQQLAPRSDQPFVEPIPDELASALVIEMFARNPGLVRNFVMVVDSGPGFDEQAQQALGDHLKANEQRSIYPASTLGSVAGKRWLAEWGGLGEQQRFVATTPTEFAVFGDLAVVTFAEWGDPSSGYVVIREPVVVAAFAGFFDVQWAQAVPAPGQSTSTDDSLVELLALGLKDEAVARYLGVGLRTVRRHIARLMEEADVSTRFQLGLSLGLERHPALPKQVRQPRGSQAGQRRLGPGRSR